MITNPDSKASQAQPATPQAQQNQWQGPYLDNPASPPAYNHHQSYPQVQQLPVPVVQYAVVQPRKSAGKRFCRALCIAIGVWLLLSILFQSSMSAVRWSFGGHHGEFKWPSVTGVDVHDCVLGDDWTLTDGPGGWRYSAETSFDLPLSSDTFLLLSRGYNLGGIVNVVTSPSQKSDTATVQVSINYRDRFDVDRAKACLLTRKKGENGVGVFTPEWDRDYYRQLHSIAYAITFTLPEGRKPLTIKNFETEVHNSHHQIADLTDKVQFKTISLKGTNGGIRAEQLTAEQGKFRTTNSGISGTFNTTKDLVLDTTNGVIRVDVGLESVNDGKVSLEAHTTNGLLEAHVSLLSESESGGIYDVKTSTSNSPLKVSFPASPYDSILDFDARTTNSPVDVSLNPAYEGPFHLSTTLMKPRVDVDDNVEDPSGKDRKRSMVIHEIRRTTVTGEVSWADKLDNNKFKASNVNVRTTNSPLNLKL